MKILMRDITAKSGRRYRIYSVPFWKHSFGVVVKIRFVFLGFIPIWKYLKDRGGESRYPDKIEFQDYTEALKYISEMELLNNKFEEKEIVHNEKTLTDKVIDDVYERN